MKLRVNAQLHQHSCPKCEQIAFAKKGIVLRCGTCTSKPVMEVGKLFSASMVATREVRDVVHKD